MKRALFVTNIPDRIDLVYSKEARERIGEHYELVDAVITEGNIEEHPETRDAEAIFSTWGMPHFTADEVKKYFPNVKYVFYGAGSVQDFAKEFLENGARVFSAATANAVPVCEYTVSVIALAGKYGFNAIKRTNGAYYPTHKVSWNCPGNYKTKVGVIGCGKIGSMVVEKTRSLINDVEFYAYDPYLSDERAEALGVTKVSLEELFAKSDVITNHLANKKELNGLLNYALFSKMKEKATFVNCGRGAQVNEKDLIRALKEVKTRSAILDVTWPEPPSLFSPLRHMKNIFLTPHIAGSLGGECKRMGDFVVDDMVSIEENTEIRKGDEVLIEMLATLA